MKMENRAVTFPQSQTILSGVNVPEVSLDDIQAILNMRDAWKYLVSAVSEPITLSFLCKLNEFTARNEALEWGRLRSGLVAISGTDYEPSVPAEDKVKAELAEIITDSSVTATEKALNAFLWGGEGSILLGGQ